LIRSTGTSHKATKTVDIVDYVQSLQGDDPVVFVIGGIAHGEIDDDFVEDHLSISHFPLSASVVCGKVCSAFERKWDVL
jgi:rRNA small subunit pseudouridine methyltransferase Nep1